MFCGCHYCSLLPHNVRTHKHVQQSTVPYIVNVAGGEPFSCCLKCWIGFELECRGSISYFSRSWGVCVGRKGRLVKQAKSLFNLKSCRSIKKITELQGSARSLKSFSFLLLCFSFGMEFYRKDENYFISDFYLKAHKKRLTMSNSSQLKSFTF